MSHPSLRVLSSKWRRFAPERQNGALVTRLDLRDRPPAKLARALRAARRRSLRRGADRVVVDLGMRRTLEPEAVAELRLLHRELRAAGGRCAVVLHPALAAQISIAYPEGLLCAGTAKAAEGLLRRPAPRRALARGERVGSSAVIATDLDGTVTHWSAGASRLYGWRPAEVVGRPITEVTVGPQDTAAAVEIMETVRRTGMWEGDFEVRRKDGTAFLAHVCNAILKDAWGRPVGLLGTSFELELDGRATARST